MPVPASIRSTAWNAAELEAYLNAQVGPIGFRRFAVFDHGAWLAKLGRPARIRSYILGIVSSTLMGRLKNPDVAKAAEGLDEKAPTTPDARRQRGHNVTVGVSGDPIRPPTNA